MEQIRSPAVAFVLLVVIQSVASHSEGNIGEFHFTIPDVTGNFNDALSWCKTNNNSTLAVVNDSNIQMALSQFLIASRRTSMMYINVQLSQKHNDTWFLLNGSNYIGDIGNQDSTGMAGITYKLYSRLTYDNNNNRFVVDASAPSAFRNYICDYEEEMCPTDSATGIVYNRRCYVKYDTEQLTWYQARERCINNSGDLAQFQTASGSNTPPFNTSWLNKSLTYWVGIRWNDLSWKSSDGGNETIFTSWSSLRPNTYRYQCVCVDPNGSPPWSWVDCSCEDTPRQFICMRTVPTTTTSTTTTTTTTRTPIITTSEVKAGFSPNSNALAIGLGAGLGGGVFIIALVVLVVVVVFLVRKRRRKNENGVDSQHIVENTRSPTTPDNELTTLDRSDVYAHVVPTTQRPSDNKPHNDVIYAQPDFSKNQNAASSGSDPTNVRQGKAQSIMLKESNDVYANAASVS